MIVSAYTYKEMYALPHCTPNILIIQSDVHVPLVLVTISIWFKKGDRRQQNGLPCSWDVLFNELVATLTELLATVGLFQYNSQTFYNKT